MTLLKIESRLGCHVAVLLFALSGIAHANSVAYQFYRFTPTLLRGPGTPPVQISEFEMRFAGAAIPGATGTNGGGTSPGGEGPEFAVDGSTGTKWLNFAGAGGGQLVLDFGFGNAVTADGYRFATANDAAERDPISWTVEGTNTPLGSWDLLDTVECHATTTARFTYEQEFLFCRPKINNFSTPTQIVVNGNSTSLDFDTINADTLEIDNTVGFLTGDTGTTTVTPPFDADTIYTLTATSTIGTADDSVTVRAVAQGAATWRYVRFTPIRRLADLPKQPGAAGIQMAEFDFFNGAVPVVPVSAVDTPTTPLPGQDAGVLIDANTFSVWANPDPAATVIFDFGTPQTIDNYRYTTGGDEPGRDPVAWILEGSDDQVCWTSIDSITVNQGDPGQDFNFVPPPGRNTDTQFIPVPAAAAVPLPQIALFGALPQIVVNGTPVVLNWQTSFACTLSIDQGVGPVTGDVGTTTATPPADADTIYTLTATNVQAQSTFFPGAVRTVAQGSATYEFVRFTPLRLAESLPFFGGANSVQISEFQFYDNSTVALDLSPSGLNVFVDNPGGNFPGGEGPDKVADGDPDTKWLDFNKEALVFDFGPGTPATFNAYGWTTANDSAERDVVAWRLEGSNDGTNWTVIDSVDQNRANPSTDIAFYFGLPRKFTLPPIPVPAAASIPPVIDLLIGDAPALFPGDSLILTWESFLATSATLDDGTGPVPVSPDGTTTVTPVANTTYTLMVTGPGGSASAQFTTQLVTSSTTDICYPNFDLAGDELNLLGNAAIVNDFANVPLPGNATRLRLTPDEASKEGTAWFAKRIDFSSGFQTFFGLHFLGSMNAGADGISFMIQNTAGGNGAEPNGFNEDGFPADSFNIKFDSFLNAGESSAGSIQVREGSTPIAEVDLATFPGITLAGTDPSDLSSDDFSVAPYRVQIDLSATGDLDIYINGVLVIDNLFVDLSSIGAIDGSGEGYTGFSARTGGEYENHDITDWLLIPGPPPPLLELTAHSFDFLADTATFTFTSGTSRTYRIKESTDGVTFTNLLTGIPGLAGSTTTVPIPFVQTPLKLFRVEVENPLKTP